MSSTGTSGADGPRPRRNLSARSRRRRRAVRTVLVAAAAVAVAVPLVTGRGARGTAAPTHGGPTATQGSQGDPDRPDARASGDTPPTQDSRTVQLAFGGDVHFEGVSRSALTRGLPTVRRMLSQADVAMVNLETAVTTRGTPAPKQFVFRAPAASLQVLRDAGVDVVTLANNHGMDYGRTGLQDTLRAAAAAGLPLVGAGGDEVAAFAPWTTTVRGLRVSVLGATDVLDTFAQRDWPAGPSTSGLASAKDPAALLAAVRAASARSDVVVVYVHWGKEMATCPSDRQRSLARQLAAAGADVVVGSHAHVLQPGGRVNGAYVHYGLGNYVFYARTSQTRATGVLTVDVGAHGVQRARWTPATITSGVPVPGRTGSVPPSRCPL
jgi:poly-gamma-glutamate capsule biosynthesis protein CapA/YwtB (metallophosphatase superfamily)